MELFKRGDRIFVTEGDMSGRRGEITAVWPAKELTSFDKAEYRVMFEDGTRHTFHEDDIEIIDPETLPINDLTILESGCRMMQLEGGTFLEKTDLDMNDGELELAVWSGDIGQPHFHFYLRGQDMEYVAPNGARPWGGCLCLEQAKYFDHGSHRQIIDEGQMESLLAYLSENSDNGMTNWQRIISLWNESNPGLRQVPLTAEIPAYRWNMVSTGQLETTPVMISESERQRERGELFEKILLTEKLTVDNDWSDYLPEGVDRDTFFSEMAEIYPKYIEQKRPKVKFRIAVVQGGEGPVPHMHMYFASKSEKREEFISYPCLHEAIYAPQHPNGKRLNAQERKALVEFLNTFRKGAFTADAKGDPIPCNCWREAVDIWLMTYGDEKGLFRYDEDGELVMPDYSELLIAD